MIQGKKRGPKPKPMHLVRNISINIAINNAEFLIIKSAALQSGMSISDYVRSAIAMKISSQTNNKGNIPDTF